MMQRHNELMWQCTDVAAVCHNLSYWTTHALRPDNSNLS
jgi:hypothetical protein